MPEEYFCKENDNHQPRGDKEHWGKKTGHEYANTGYKATDERKSLKIVSGAQKEIKRPYWGDVGSMSDQNPKTEASA
ncbi:MAG: hypothetical protein ACO2YV_01380 [Pseudomonadales bacterium]